MAKKSPAEEHMSLLGQQMKDVVTGAVGMVSTISFDAYGCVQAVLTQKVNKDGTKPDSRWFDVKRLQKFGKRIMDVPPHFTTPVGSERGPAEKPARDF